MRKVLTLLLFGIAAASPAANWTNFNAINGTFRIMFPSAVVQVQSHSVLVGTFSLTYTSYRSVSDDMKCMVTTCPIPPGMSSQEQDRFIKAIFQGFKANARVDQFTTDNKVIGNFGGQYMKTLFLDQEMGLWVVARKDYIYALSCSAQSKHYFKVEGAFLDNFQLRQGH